MIAVEPGQGGECLPVSFFIVHSVVNLLEEAADDSAQRGKDTFRWGVCPAGIFVPVSPHVLLPPT